MKCRYCHKMVIYTTEGIGAFCDERCKKLHKTTARAKNETTGAILKVKVPKVTHSIPLDDKSLKTKIDEEFGGEYWYNLSKRECCNFDVKYKLGYCVTLFSPCNGFRCKCSDCEIGKSLKKRIDKPNKNNK
jgi:hypothetical protein